MKLIYIYHSGYAIETDNFSIIIDYFKDSSDMEGKGIVHEYLLHKPDKLYVLSTHSHYDHFNRDILKWKEKKENITYIFSKDILDDHKAKPNEAIYLDKLDEYKDEHLQIKAFGSTDKGISFYIETENKKIFHAGDLNNWHWNEESTDEEVKEAEEYYNSELTLLANEVKYLDLAMFPVDPRLGKDYMKGAEEFISRIKTDIFAPMHFDTAYDKAAAFASYAASKGCKCICWSKKGDDINF